jgi:hypothetical protein
VKTQRSRPNAKFVHTLFVATTSRPESISTTFGGVYARPGRRHCNDARGHFPISSQSQICAHPVATTSRPESISTTVARGHFPISSQRHISLSSSSPSVFFVFALVFVIFDVEAHGFQCNTVQKLVG